MPTTSSVCFSTSQPPPSVDERREKGRSAFAAPLSSVASGALTGVSADAERRLPTALSTRAWLKTPYSHAASVHAATALSVQNGNSVCCSAPCTQNRSCGCGEVLHVILAFGSTITRFQVSRAAATRLGSRSSVGAVVAEGRQMGSSSWIVFEAKCRARSLHLGNVACRWNCCATLSVSHSK